MKLLLAASLAVAFVGPAKPQLFPPNEAGVTMGHIHLNVRDVEAHRKLWVEQFGAVPIERGRLQGVKIPGMLILFRRREPAGGSEGTVLDHFGLRVRNLPDVLQRWRAAGLLVQREFKGTEGFPNAYVMAPDGVKLELQQDVSLSTPAVSHHLHYYVADYGSIRDWYTKTFSLRPSHRGAHESADVPGMNLSFQPAMAPPGMGTKGRALDHIGFEVKNLEAFCQKLEAGGVKFDVPYRKVPDVGMGIAFLTDPLGVSIELTEGLESF